MPEIRIYQTQEKDCPFENWLDHLSDINAKARILQKVDRVELGNFGDCEPVGDGVHELRIDHGSGYRMYFGNDGKHLVILLCGGTKKRQVKTLNRLKCIGKTTRPGKGKTAHLPLRTGKKKELRNDQARQPDYKSVLLKKLKDPKLAEAYINSALEHGTGGIISCLEKCMRSAWHGTHSQKSKDQPRKYVPRVVCKGKPSSLNLYLHY